MRISRLAVASCVLLGCAHTTKPLTTADAQNKMLPPLALDVNHYRDYLQTISGDDFLGRGPGTAGEKRTVEYLVAQLKEMGLKPGFGDRYTQAVPMLELTGTAPIPLRVSFKDQVLNFKYGDDVVTASRMPQAKIAVNMSDIVFVGYGVNAPEMNWNDYAGIDVKGKTVITLINDPGFQVGDEKLFNGKAMTYYGRWTYKFEECARQGAAACLIVHDDAGAAYGWDVVKNSWSGPQHDLPLAADETAPVKIQGWISGPAAQKIFSKAGWDLPQMYKDASRPGFKAMNFPARADLQIDNIVRRTDSHNVMAVLPGTSAADEAVIYTGHWDHLGQSFNAPGDRIFNGAVDNGTGVAGLLELARAHVAAGPRARSVGFLFFTLEESGLLGSRYYAANPSVPLKQIVATINMDAMPILPPTNDMVVIGYGNSELEDILREILRKQGRTLQPEATPENGYYFRSDHFNMAKVGVPSLYAKTGIDVIGKGAEFGKAAALDYAQNRYHKPSDQFDPSWDLSGTVHDLGILGAVGDQLANSAAWPNWYAGNAFKAARDAMRKESP
jgi:Zn-dependent M28 family amino/carboxypeptidase